MYSPPLTRSRAKNLKRKSIHSGTTMNAQSENTKKNEENIEEVLFTTGTKKIKLSQDEKHLNGAPEGDIYDITVLSDENLSPLASPEGEWETVAEILTSSTSTWAENHAAIETIRRISIHHQELLNGEHILLALSEATKATGSLRSCICRNGILCLQSLYRLPFFSNLLQGSNKENFFESISILMNKSVNGPKFICATALVALEIGVERTPVSLLCPTLQPLTLHKNAEIVNRSFVLIAQQARKHKTALLREGDEVLAALLLLLDRGMDCPRPAGREASRKALDSIVASIGASRAQSIVEKMVLDEDKRVRILKVVQRVQGASAAVSACFSPKPGKSAAPKPRSQLKAPKPPPRASFKDHIKMWKTQQKQQDVVVDPSAPSTSASSSGSDSTSLDSVQLII
jgi:hypothetical protein